MGIKQGPETTIHTNGKTVFTLFPEVVTRFWFEAHKNHPDLIQAMALARVNVQDKSAFDFLNRFLNVQVTPDMPMEKGYGIYLDALNKRSKNIITEHALQDLTRAHKSDDIEDAGYANSQQIFEGRDKK